MTTPNTYTVTVTAANGCTATATTEVLQNIVAPTAGLTNDGPLTCIKTSVTLTGAGGGTYAYSGGSATVTTPATYTVTVTAANGCTATSTTAVMGATTAPVASATKSGNISCSVTSATLDASASTGFGTIAYAWTATAGGTFTGATNAAMATAATAGTYQVEVTANGCTSTSTVAVTGSVQGSDNVVLATTAVNGISEMPECTDAVWTYYGLPADGTSNTFFAINWNPLGLTGAASNATVKAVATVTVQLDAALTAPTMSAATGERTYTMKRYWNVDMGGQTIDPSNPVKIRFYYDAAEKTAIENAAAADLAASQAINGANGIEPFRWFKTDAGAFNPATNVTPPDVTGVAEMTVETVGVENGVTFVQFQNIDHFSGGTGAIGLGPKATPLPVELLYFKGAVVGADNQLDWATATEKNSAFFAVERSTNGQTFSEVARVNASNNTTTEVKYNTTDKAAPSKAYYRLRMVDRDGQFKFSNTVYLEHKRGALAINNVYPIPTESGVTVEYEAEQTGKVTFAVYDAIGRLVFVDSFDAFKGAQTYQLDLTAYPTGVYLLQLDQAGSKRAVRRIVRN